MYTTRNFKTKKEMTNAVSLWRFFTDGLFHLRGVSPTFSTNTHGEVTVNTEDGDTFPLSEYVRDSLRISMNDVPRPVMLYSPGLGTPKADGEETVEGPWYPQPHKWYAVVEVRNGIVVKVK